MIETLKSRIEHNMKWAIGKSFSDNYDKIKNEYRLIIGVLKEMFWKAFLTHEEWHELESYASNYYDMVLLSMKY